MDDRTKRLWALFDNQRAAGRVPTIQDLFDLAEEHHILLNTYDLWTIGNRLSGREWLCPPAVSSFFVTLLGKTKIERIFNPWLSHGTLLSPIVTATAPDDVVALHPDSNVIDAARHLLPAGTNATLQVANLSSEDIDGLGVFDVVVSVPPFNMHPVEKFTINEVGIRDFATNAILGRSLNMLSETGVGFFVVAPSFWFHPKGASIRERLNDLGIYVDAAFSFPVGVFSPITAIPCDLLVFRRGKPAASMFCGEVGEDFRRRKTLVANYAKRREATDPRLGFLADFEDFRGVSSLVAQFEITKKAKRLGVPQRLLSDLTIEIRSCPKEKDSVKEKPNSFFLPLNASSKIKTSKDQLPKKPMDYMQVVVDPKKAEAHLVAAHLQSPLGQEIRFAFALGSTIRRIPRDEIGELPVFLPEPEGQQKILQIDKKIGEMTSELAVLREELWQRMDKAPEILRQLDRFNRDDTFKDWLETLPFPLASILWTYHTLQDQPLRRYQQLDLFFEGLAEYLAVLLVSGVRRDQTLFKVERDIINALLDRQHLSLKTASFGTWVVIYERLAKTVRGLLETKAKGDGENLSFLWKKRFAAPGGPLMGDLCSKNISSILKDANHLRNSWRGHGGVISNSEAKRREVRLKELLTKFREIVGRKWEDYLLVIPGACRFTKGEYTYVVSVAQGFAFPFQKRQLNFCGPLEDGQLNLVGIDTGTSCPLAPLVRLGSAPKTEKNACYFFNRFDGEQLRFVSYHFEGKPEIQEQFEMAREFIQDFTASD